MIETLIGVTATREGLTRTQLQGFYSILSQSRVMNDLRDEPNELHHGDCQGGDEQLWVLATVLGYRTVAHPPVKDQYRAYTDSDVVLSAKPYLDRDRDVVDATGILLAGPKSMTEDGGGTWYTVNYARGIGRSVIIVWPDGTIIEEKN